MGNEYYYQQMNKEQQKAYYAIKEGLTNIASSFPVPILSGPELADIYFKVRLDHPEIFYSMTYKYRYYPDSNFVELIPDYMFEKNKIKEHKQAMEARIRKLILPAQKLDSLQKELYIHDFICQNITYDKLKKPYSHEIIGALGQGVSVCEGISKAVKILCDRLGIWCIIAISEANPDKNIKYRHAWNVIKLDQHYYHLDATFDNSIGNKEMIRYDYFNLCDEQIYRDHEPSIWRLPSCDNRDHFYYKEKKLSFTKMEEVKKRAMQAAKKGKVFLFHWRGSYLTRAVLQEIITILQEAADEKNKTAKISINWPQSIIKVSFDESLGDGVMLSFKQIETDSMSANDSEHEERIERETT